MEGTRGRAASVGEGVERRGPVHRGGGADRCSHGGARAEGPHKTKDGTAV